MNRLLASAVLLAGLCATAQAANPQMYGLSDCLNGSVTLATRACQMKLLAAYQSVQVAQVRYGMTAKSCQYGATVEPDRLISNLRAELIVASSSSDAQIAVLGFGVLTTPVDCPSGIAKQVGGLSAGQVFSLCKSEPPSGGMDVCLAYIAGLRDALTAAWLSDGTKHFMCPAERSRLVDDKESMKLFLEELKNDIKKQAQRPAAELMAEALTKRYPCP